MGFDEKPNYEYLTGLMKEMIGNLEIDKLVYDWRKLLTSSTIIMENEEKNLSKNKSFDENLKKKQTLDKSLIKEHDISNDMINVIEEKNSVIDIRNSIIIPSKSNLKKTTKSDEKNNDNCFIL